MLPPELFPLILHYVDRNDITLEIYKRYGTKTFPEDPGALFSNFMKPVPFEFSRSVLSSVATGPMNVGNTFSKTQHYASTR
jgi:hypothetical protein